MKKLLVVHNGYIGRGGEDVCVDNEISALKELGWDIRDFRLRSRPTAADAWRALAAPAGGGHESKLESVLLEWRPDIVHAHNLYPLLSARLFPAAKRAGAQTFLTLHNFRPLCLNGLFLTPANEVCERCAIAGHFGPGITRGCYRGNRIQSLGLAAHLQWARSRKWYEAVDCFISPSAFLKEKFSHYGFPKHKIAVQPHFLSERHADPVKTPEPYVLFVGRLSEEKGIRWLLKIFRKNQSPFQLRIAGQGPLEDLVRENAGARIQYLGYISGSEKRSQMQSATALILPSTCYENFPMAVIEANACGTPALVSRLGGLAEIVSDAERGSSFITADEQSFWAELKDLVRRTESTQARSLCQAKTKDQYSKEIFLRNRVALYEGAP